MPPRGREKRLRGSSGECPGRAWVPASPAALTLPPLPRGVSWRLRQGQSQQGLCSGPENTAVCFLVRTSTSCPSPGLPLRAAVKLTSISSQD